MSVPNGNSSGPKMPLYTAPTWQAGEGYSQVANAIKGIGEAGLAARKANKEGVANDQAKAEEQRNTDTVPPSGEEELAPSVYEAAPSAYTGSHVASPRLPFNGSRYQTASQMGGNPNLSAVQHSTSTAQSNLRSLSDSTKVKPLGA